ncbi:MAG: SusF/SusE family outer membrane protein [Prevotella sp.]|nr:SusF/SusE family outer membrane protein [Prevotella sp.]
MNKIFSNIMLLAAGALMMVSCNDDQDSNPTLLQPTGFQLNTPSVVNGTVDMERTESIDLTWSQPQYTADNAPVIATYYVQVSTKGTFNKAFDITAEDNTGADFFTLEETTTECKTTVPMVSIAKALQQLNAWEEGAVPEKVELSIRLKSAVLDAGMNTFGEVVSNVVKISAIPYYIELKDADPNWWYLIGGDIADGNWADDVPTSLFPMQPQKDYEFDKKTGDGEFVWTGYLAGNGFKLKKAPGDWDHQWGMNGSDFVENDGGSGNIVMPQGPGYYTVTLNTGKHEMNVEPYEGNVTPKAQMYILGDFNGWAQEDNCKMKPVSTFAGAVNHDWWIEIELPTGGIKFNQGDWDFNIGGPATPVSDGFYGYGTQNGDNIAIETAGKYLIILNDITGYYRFILK